MRVTRWVAAAVILFLLDAAQILLLVPDRTAELFAWPIDPEITSMVLGAAYVGGGYYFARVVFADGWHRVAAGLPPVILFVWLAALATALHSDKFTPGVPFAAWAAIYAVAPIGLPLLLHRPAPRGAAGRAAAAGRPGRARRRRWRRDGRGADRLRAARGHDRRLAVDADAPHGEDRRDRRRAVRRRLALRRRHRRARPRRGSRCRPTASAWRSCSSRRCGAATTSTGPTRSRGRSSPASHRC